MHLLDGGPRHGRVVLCVRRFPRRVALPELKVRHVNVDQALHELERVEAVVGAAVVDDGDAEALARSDGERLDHLGVAMGGRSGRA